MNLRRRHCSACFIVYIYISIEIGFFLSFFEELYHVIYIRVSGLATRERCENIGEKTVEHNRSCNTVAVAPENRWLVINNDNNNNSPARSLRYRILYTFIIICI